MKRFTCFLLALLLCIGILPAPASALAPQEDGLAVHNSDSQPSTCNSESGNGGEDSTTSSAETPEGKNEPTDSTETTEGKNEPTDSTETTEGKDEPTDSTESTESVDEPTDSTEATEDLSLEENASLMDPNDPPVLRAMMEGFEHPVGNLWRLATGFESNRVRFYLAGNNSYDPSQYLTGTITSDNSQILSISGPDEEGYYTIKAGQNNGNTALTYTDEQGSSYTLLVAVQAVYYHILPVQPEGRPDFLNLSEIEMGAPIKLRCILSDGFDMVGQFPLNGLTSSDEQIFTLHLSDDPEEAVNNVYILTPKSPGIAQICYTHTDGNSFTYRVGILGKVFPTEGMVYFPAIDHNTGKTFPQTVLDLSPNSTFEKKFYYSHPAEAAMLAAGTSQVAPLTLQDVTFSGNIEVTAGNSEGTLCIRTGPQSGTGYLEVTDESGIVHCFVVNVGRPAPNSEVQKGGYMWLDENIVLGFGNPGIEFDGNEFFQTGVLNMLSQIANGYSDETPYSFREPMCFAAMTSKDGKYAAAVASDVMRSVRNVQFSVLSCRNTDGTEPAYPQVELETCEPIQLAEDNIIAWTNYLVAPSQKGFLGLVGMSFDLPDSKDGQPIIRRLSLYLHTHNAYMGKDITVTANIQSAAQLNVILSSYEALKSWIKAEYPEYAGIVDQVHSINLELPGGTFTDTLVVSEAIAPFPFMPSPSSNPNFRVFLIGSQKGKKTTLAGLVSRGSLCGIQNIQFLANENVTMTHGNERFTCGLMADSEWSGQVEYDMDFARKYDIDPTQNKRSLSGWNNELAHLDCDIMFVENCSFEGFDYGNRSTANGYVGSGPYNSYKKCYYGIYIDCPNKKGFGELTFTNFGQCDFKKNVVAVRIKSLQNNVSPYEFRIHDSDFINNYLEFWIDNPAGTPQTYYFYRNHYSGGWNKVTGQWYQFKDAPLGNETIPPVSHRGPKYHPDMQNGVNILVSGTPSRMVPNLPFNVANKSGQTDGYWIYSGADQVTRLEPDGDRLPLAQESLTALKEDTDVSIVTDNGQQTVAVWTFEGGA